MNKMDKIPDLMRLSFWREGDRQEIKQVNHRVCEPGRLGEGPRSSGVAVVK